MAVHTPPPPVDFDAHRIDKGPLTPLQLKLAATWLGPFRGLPPTGASYRCRQCVLFLFEEDRLVIERVYFDAITVLRQLGLADDPTKMRGQLTAVLPPPSVVV